MPATPSTASDGKPRADKPVLPEAEIIAVVKLRCPICGGQWTMNFGGTPTGQLLAQARQQIRNSVQSHMDEVHGDE